MKKLLMLGGAFSQVPAIKKAKEMGYYVITCDYLPENPGHKYSDEYVNISTVDKEAVLEYAINAKIDGISAYASDPAAVTAAYVADKLNLPGTGLDATRILSEKDKYREFLAKNGFNCPNYISVTCIDDIKETSSVVGFPCFVKPVDSSGSKGVKKVDNASELENAVIDALSFSRAKRAIIESEIESPYNQFHGDGFVYKGKLVFLCLGEQFFHNEVPIGSGCPNTASGEMKERMHDEVQKIIESVGFETGAINVELRVTSNDEVYTIEIGARSGGNFVPQLMENATGFDEMTACILGAMEKDFKVPQPNKEQYTFQYIIGGYKAGRFKEMWIDPSLKDKVKQLFLLKRPGDEIVNYKNSSGVTGVAIISLDDQDEMINTIKNIKKLVIAEVE